MVVKIIRVIRHHCIRWHRLLESFYNVLYTLPLFVSQHRPLERGIHTCLFVGAGSEICKLSPFGTGF